MRRLLAVCGTAVIVAAMGIWSAAPSYAAGCTGVIANQTIYDNVVVPSGASCDLEADTIFGNVTVQPGGALQLAVSTVYGNVSADGATGMRLAVGSNMVVGVDVIYGNVSITNLTDDSLGNNAI